MDVPISFSRVLVVSGSSVFRELLRLTLDPHSGEVLVAADRREGRDQLARYSPLDVVICDVSLSNGDGFGLLDDVAALGEARPEVILVAGQPMADEEQRALEKGAVGYLEKPIAFRDIAGIVKRRTGGVAQWAPRRRPGGRACLLGVGDQIDLPDAGQPPFWRRNRRCRSARSSTSLWRSATSGSASRRWSCAFRSRAGAVAAGSASASSTTATAPWRPSRPS
jgi:CheY-like chemotaxis protein